MESIKSYFREFHRVSPTVSNFTLSNYIIYSDYVEYNKLFRHYAHKIYVDLPSATIKRKVSGDLYLTYKLVSKQTLWEF